ncbi:hypothetical protein ABFZ85_00885 [Hyphococcus formosus]|uniref:hypothetical protein n=1 Tax=Hyphococcus formosus TaxID=3143534 RepID=UPI00398B82E5
MTRIFLTLIGFIGATITIAQAQTSQRAWSPYEENPTCLISKTYFNKIGTMWSIPTYSDAAMILKWHVAGDQFTNELSYTDIEKFSACFDGQRDCGLPVNHEIANTLKSREIAPGSATDAYFKNPPPESAIRFAMGTVGDCFGTAGSGIFLDEVGMSEMALPMDICTRAGKTIYWRGKRERDQAPKMTDAQIARYDNWGRLVFGMTNLRKNRPDPKPETCSLVPSELVPSFMAFYDENGYGAASDAAAIAAAEQAAQQEAKEKAEAKAREIAYLRESKRKELLSRTDRERFGTLDGCQIAYSYIFAGINRPPTSFIVDPVPDGAIGWALRYEQAHKQGNACPPMPEVLSDWLQKQDTKLFVAYGASYEFRGKRPVVYNDNDWKNFAEKWMWRNQTISDPDYRQGSNCYAAVWHARNIAHDWSSMTLAEQDFVGLALKTKPWGAPGSAFCTVIPPEILPLAHKTWSRAYNQQMRAEAAQQAKWDAANAKEAARRAQIDAAYDALGNWKPSNNAAVSTRCYNTETTKYGVRQTCFTN